MKYKILSLIAVSSMIYSCSSVNKESDYLERLDKREIASDGASQAQKLYPYEVAVSPKEFRPGWCAYYPASHRVDEKGNYLPHEPKISVECDKDPDEVINLVDPDLSRVRSVSRDEKGNFPIINFSGEIESVLDDCDKEMFSDFTIDNCSVVSNGGKRSNTQKVILNFTYFHTDISCKTVNRTITKKMNTSAQVDFNKMVSKDIKTVQIIYNKNIVGFDQMRYNNEYYFYSRIIAKNVRWGSVFFPEPGEKIMAEPRNDIVCK